MFLIDKFKLVRFSYYDRSVNVLINFIERLQGGIKYRYLLSKIMEQVPNLEKDIVICDEFCVETIMATGGFYLMCWVFGKGGGD